MSGPFNYMALYAWQTMAQAIRLNIQNGIQPPLEMYEIARDELQKFYTPRPETVKMTITEQMLVATTLEYLEIFDRTIERLRLMREGKIPESFIGLVIPELEHAPENTTKH